jgi:hypothetical protein
MVMEFTELLLKADDFPVSIGILQHKEEDVVGQ